MSRLNILSFASRKHAVLFDLTGGGAQLISGLKKTIKALVFIRVNEFDIPFFK